MNTTQKWFVAVCCFDPKCLEDPLEFISNPSTRRQPTWLFGIVEAIDRNQAFTFAEIAFEKDELTPRGANTALANWYAEPFHDDAPIPVGLAVLSYSAADVAARFRLERPFTTPLPSEPSRCELCGAYEEYFGGKHGTMTRDQEAGSPDAAVD